MNDNKYEIIEFEDGDLNLDVRISVDENTVWLNNEQIAILYGRDRSVISRHIKKIYDEEKHEKDRTCATFAQVQHEGNRKVSREIEYFNLEIITSVGYRIKSIRTSIFRDWSLNILNKLKSKNGLTKPLILFKYNEICLDVSVSPDEDTVWLNKDQLTILFQTTRQNIEYHINKIYEQNELEECLTCKEILHFTDESSRYEYRTSLAYNLDMIISLGYRINSKNGIIFRKWATKILKEYLLKGSVINEERCLVCTSNIISLQNKVENIESKIEKIEENIYKSESIIYEGEILEPYTFLRKLFFLAKKEITIIDYYADKFLLSMLSDIKVKIVIITSSNSYLNKEKLNDNIHIIHNDIFHDRFIIIDDTVYNLGTSFNEIGKKRFVIIKLENITKEMLLK